jgi:RNA-directed DNA polymerase
VYTFIADRPLRSVKAKIRGLTHRVSQANMGTVIGRINQILRGWTAYFRHAVCKHTLSHLKHFADWRVIRWLRKRHRWTWGQFRRRFTTPTGRWLPIAANEVTLFNPASVTVTRYRYRGEKIPNPFLRANHA